MTKHPEYPEYLVIKLHLYRYGCMVIFLQIDDFMLF